MSGDVTATHLRSKFESVRDDRDWYHDSDKSNLPLRTHRAISWIERAEEEAKKETNDLASQFIFYWIAFNAAYGRKIPDGHIPACEEFKTYFDKVVNLDRIYLGRITDATREGKALSGSIENLLGNTFIFQPRWDDHNSEEPSDDWINSFREEWEEYEKAIDRGGH